MTLTTKFSGWVLTQSRLVQYSTIALIFHLVLIASIASIKLAKIVIDNLPSIPIVEQNFLTPTTDPTDTVTGDNGQNGQNGQRGGDLFGDRNKPPTPKQLAMLDTKISKGMPDTIRVVSDFPIGDNLNQVIGDSTHFTPGVTIGDLARLGDLKGTDNPYGNRPGLQPGTSGIPGTPGSGKPGTPPDPIKEKPVLAGLRWLKEHQEDDGSWKCAQSAQAGSALAVLAFLGHGELGDSREFGTTVTKGLSYLAQSIDQDGLVAGRNMYAQGAVTLALAEGYTLTRSPFLQGPLERALKAIIRIQSVAKSNPRHTGGWRYSPSSNDADTSVSGWMIMALKSAKIAGLDVPDENIQSAIKYLWQMYGDHGFGYLEPKKTPNTTAIGVLCLQFLGQSEDQRIKDALDYLHHQKPSWDKTTGGFVLYGWYYATLAMQQAGGAYWKQWEPAIRETLVNNQADDGHWPAPPQSSAESQTLAATPAYSTALATLILEASYRYKQVTPTAVVLKH